MGAIQHITQARLPTLFGEFQIHLFHDEEEDKDHVALVMGDVQGEAVMVRIHSECFTGDVLGSLRCDCREQLLRSLEIIAQEGRGVLVYLRQEGRGIGLADKLRAYNLQDQGYDTVEANLLLGHQADERHYDAAAAILKFFGVRSVRLLTNNPDKIQALEALGVPVVERVPLTPTVHPENARYLRTKALRLHHLLDLSELNGSEVA